MIPGALEKYSHDLTALARQGQFTPLQRREKEVERVFQVLARRLKNNPMLIGEDSAERFAVAAEVIRRISTGDAPEVVRVRRVVTPDLEAIVPEKVKVQRAVALDLEALVRDTQERGDFEKLLKSIFVEIKQSEGQILLFIDNFPRLAGAGRAENAIDMANILAPALSRGEVCILGTSTLDNYRKYVERDAALQRHFQEIVIREPGD